MIATHYPNTKAGKAAFIADIIDPFVQTEEHFIKAEYVTSVPSLGEGEWIKLTTPNKKEVFININLDSIQAVARDFVRQYFDCITKAQEVDDD